MQIFILLACSIIIVDAIIKLKLEKSELPLSSLSDPMRFSSSPRSKSLRLKNIFNIQYVVKFFVGDDRKAYRLIVDTGSTWMWISSQECKCNDLGIFNFYKCEVDSNNCIFSKDSVYGITYGIGKVKGYVTRDKIYFNRFEKDGFDQHFLSVTEISELNKLHADGLLGIGKSKKMQYYPNLIQTLKNEKIIEKEIFSFYLTGRMCEFDSIFTLGGIDPTQYTGEIIWAKSISEHYWAVDVDEVKLGNSTLAFTAEIALIDSGSSEIVLQPADFTTLLGTLNQEFKLSCVEYQSFARVFQIFCLNYDISAYPDFYVTINGSSLVIPAKKYIRDCRFSNIGFYCKTHFMKDMSYSGMTILGEVFMNIYYTVFDLEANIIGFAKAINSEEDVIDLERVSRILVLISFGLFVLTYFLIFNLVKQAFKSKEVCMFFCKWEKSYEFCIQRF